MSCEAVEYQEPSALSLDERLHRFRARIFADVRKSRRSSRRHVPKGEKALTDKAGRTALMAAASAGRTENMRLLLDKGANIDSKDNDGNTALLVSAGAGPYSAVGVVYTANPVKLLLERGADIEARNQHGDTALILAASKGGYEDATTVRLLLDRGADVAAKKQSRTDRAGLRMEESPC
jgi:Ankyrin repeats (3 copies)/Ankyrin repeat